MRSSVKQYISFKYSSIFSHSRAIGLMPNVGFACVGMGAQCIRDICTRRRWYVCCLETVATVHPGARVSGVVTAHFPLERVHVPFDMSLWCTLGWAVDVLLGFLFPVCASRLHFSVLVHNDTLMILQSREQGGAAPCTVSLGSLHAGL